MRSLALVRHVLCRWWPLRAMAGAFLFSSLFSTMLYADHGVAVLQAGSREERSQRDSAGGKRSRPRRAQRDRATGSRQRRVDPQMELDHGLSEQIASYDWESEAALMRESMIKIWKRNGWKSESDRYALELTAEVASIPPWEPMKRIDFVSGEIAQRYGIDSTGAMRIKSRMIIDLGEFLGKNSDVIMKNMREGMNARMAGEPFTAEQVQEWMEAGAAFEDDVDVIMDRFIAEIETMVDPTHREIFEADLKSFRKRDEDVKKMAARWRRGEWKPSDWGMENDPVQRGEHPGLRREAGKEGVPSAQRVELPDTWHPHIPGTWIAFVVEFKNAFDLDAGQVTTIESIHTEMLRRATAYERSRREEMARVPEKERADHEVYAPLVDYFLEMTDRFDAVLRSGQRTPEGP
ncbi:MAG: hypothetical protein ACYTHJ_00200 [Planctomycetota bacterium]|jgi:hypothetical protein